MASSNRVNSSWFISGKNLPKRNLILKIGGTNFQFNYTSFDPGGGYPVIHSWGQTNKVLYDFLGARINQRLECIPQN